MNKFVKTLFKMFMAWLVAFICVVLGWNVFLRLAFQGIYEVPVLGIGQLCWLTLGITFFLAPVGMYTFRLIRDWIEKNLKNKDE